MRSSSLSIAILTACIALSVVALAPTATAGDIAVSADAESSAHVTCFDGTGCPTTISCYTRDAKACIGLP